MNLRASLYAAVAAVAVAPAAQAYEGWYGAIGAGLSYMDPDLDTQGVGPSTFDTNGDYDNGIGVYTAFGYAFDSGVRVELEYSYRQNDVRHFAGDGLGFSGFNTANGNFDGELDAHALMINALYDFKVNDTITPFIGAGAGVASFGGEFSGIDGAFAGGPSNLSISERGVRRLAGQLIAGVNFALADNLGLDLSYRYFIAARDPRFDGTLQLDGVSGPQSVRTDYQNHGLFAGLRWNFGAPAPRIEYKDCWDGSSVPVSSPCPPQPVDDVDVAPGPISFPVYFGYDKANLTADAMTAIQNAAAQALQNDIDVVLVSGNTDTSGNAEYNQRLSERRAQVVRDALIANGVPAGSISTEANGERNLAKPTPDGVREPLNRRAEVVISFQ
ncbi:MAG: OmpA family protein [Pseudomonadota bacterium]